MSLKHVVLVSELLGDVIMNISLECSKNKDGYLKGQVKTGIRNPVASLITFVALLASSHGVDRFAEIKAWHDFALDTTIP